MLPKFRTCFLKLKRKQRKHTLIPLSTCNHLRLGALPEYGSSASGRFRLATCNVGVKKSVSRAFMIHSVCSSKVRGFFILDIFHKTSGFQLSRRLENLAHQLRLPTSHCLFPDWICPRIVPTNFFFFFKKVHILGRQGIFSSVSGPHPHPVCKINE